MLRSPTLASGAFAAHIGNTVEQQKRALRDLIEIGTALNQRSWDNDLQQITNIGPEREKILNDLGVFTFKDLAQIDPDTKATFEKKVGWKNSVDKMIGDAQKLVARGPDADAEIYLSTIREFKGFFVQGDGSLEVIVRQAPTENGDPDVPRVPGKATLFTFDVLAAPRGHDGCRRLANALGGYLEVCGEIARIPDFSDEHLNVLKVMYHTLEHDAPKPFDEEAINARNERLEGSGLELRPAHQYDSIHAAGQPPANQGQPGYESVSSAMPVYYETLPPAPLPDSRSQDGPNHEADLRAKGGARIQGMGHKGPAPMAPPDPDARDEDRELVEGNGGNEDAPQHEVPVEERSPENEAPVTEGDKE